MFANRGKALTFDDILLVPNYSEVTPDMVDVSTWLTPDIPLKSPLLSAAMDTVTEAAMAISMARMGGIGVIHKNMSIASQRLEVEKVKKSESGMILDPVTITSNSTVQEALDLMHDFSISGLPVVDDGCLTGILTNRDVRFVSDGTKVLADNGSYVSLPSQGLDGSRIFVANWARSVIQPVVGIALDILYPTDVSPVPGRDYAIIQNGGRFGPITQPVPDGEYVMPLDKAVNINGDSLDYEWSGTSLRIGVRSGTTGETTWGNYVNLKGAEYQSMVTTSVTMDPSDNSSVTSAITSMIESNTDYATIEISNTTGGTYSLPTSILQGFLLSRGKKVTYLYFHNNTDCTINFTKSAVYHKFPKSGLSIPAKTAIEVSIAYTGGVFVFTVSEELEV